MHHVAVCTVWLLVHGLTLMVIDSTRHWTEGMYDVESKIITVAIAAYNLSEYDY